MSIVIVKRTKKNRVKGTPTIKFYSFGNYFTFSYKAKDLLDINAGDGVMFAFNFKEKKAFVFKEDDEDSFKLNKIQNRNILRFGSKELADYFNKCFCLTNEKKHIFELRQTDNEKFEMEYVP